LRALTAEASAPSSERQVGRAVRAERLHADLGVELLLPHQPAAAGIEPAEQSSDEHP
jgi:hypothetical protein